MRYNTDLFIFINFTTFLVFISNGEFLLSESIGHRNYDNYTRSRRLRDAESTFKSSLEIFSIIQLHLLLNIEMENNC